MNVLDRKTLSPWTRPKRPWGRNPVLEPLEQRHLPSVALPGIVATQPADGTVLLHAPPELAISFDPAEVNQIDDLLAGFFGPGFAPDQTLAAIVAADDYPGGNAEVAIDRIDPGGTSTPVLGVGAAMPVQANVAVQADAQGNVTQAQIVFTPAGGGPALGPGTYQIDIQPGTALAAIFGSFDFSGAWAANQPIPIARFTVLGPGTTLDDATSLGTIGPATQDVSGFVDPQSSSTAVSLYQFTLPAGQLWQLNARVLSKAVGSPLLGALTLFDAQGNVLAENNAGEGPAADPSDPALIDGLEPGTYYLGVSAANNLPGWTGGYDLATGTPGTAGFTEPSGPFLLQVSAVPVVATTTVLNVNLDHADPLEPSPTGLEVTFSGPVDAAPLFVPDRQETALEVVDATGQTWPITAVSDELSPTSAHTLGFIFNEPLPAGSYALIEPAQGGLTDLAGQPIATPAGNPTGVLARWTVEAAEGPGDPNNLGVLWPGPVNVTWDSSISRITGLAGGQDATYQFVVICPGVYEVQTHVPTGAVDLEVTGPDGTSVLAATDLKGLNQLLMQLGSGGYRLRLTAVGSEPAEILWTLRPVALDYEKIIENGVGQTPVLTLSLVDSLSTTAGQVATSSAGAADGIAVAATAGASGSASIATTLVASPIPASLFLVSMDTGLMGLPAATAQTPAAVGPLAEGALASVADRVNGLMPGIRYGSGSDVDPRLGGSAAPQDPGPAGDRPEEAALAAADPVGTPGARGDARVLVRVDRLLGLVDWLESKIAPSWFGGWFNTTGTPASPIAPETLAQADIPAGTRSRRPSRRDNVVEADLTLPLAVIATAAAAYRLRRSQVTTRGDRKAPTAGGPRRPHFFARRGPHAPACHAPTIHRVRFPQRPA